MSDLNQTNQIAVPSHVETFHVKSDATMETKPNKSVGINEEFLEIVLDDDEEQAEVNHSEYGKSMGLQMSPYSSKCKESSNKISNKDWVS